MARCGHAWRRAPQESMRARTMAGCCRSPSRRSSSSIRSSSIRASSASREVPWTTSCLISRARCPPGIRADRRGSRTEAASRRGAGASSQREPSDGSVGQRAMEYKRRSRMMMRTLRRMMTRMTVVGVCVLEVAGCAGSVKLGPEAVKGKTPDGTVDMREVQAAYIGSGAGGEGVLTFRGRNHPFKVGGVGIGGIGLSTIDAHGEVYNLAELSQFPGTYGQARYGFAIGTERGGDLWMQNEAGVILHLKAKREGLMLSLGGDAVEISMSR